MLSVVLVPSFLSKIRILKASRRETMAPFERLSSIAICEGVIPHLMSRAVRRSLEVSFPPERSFRLFLNDGDAATTVSSSSSHRESVSLMPRCDEMSSCIRRYGPDERMSGWIVTGAVDSLCRASNFSRNISRRSSTVSRRSDTGRVGVSSGCG